MLVSDNTKFPWYLLVFKVKILYDRIFKSYSVNLGLHSQRYFFRSLICKRGGKLQRVTFRYSSIGKEDCFVRCSFLVKVISLVRKEVRARADGRVYILAGRLLGSVMFRRYLRDYCYDSYRRVISTAGHAVIFASCFYGVRPR